MVISPTPVNTGKYVTFLKLGPTGYIADFVAVVVVVVLANFSNTDVSIG